MVASHVRNVIFSVCVAYKLFGSVSILEQEDHAFRVGIRYEVQVKVQDDQETRVWDRIVRKRQLRNMPRYRISKTLEIQGKELAYEIFEESSLACLFIA